MKRIKLFLVFSTVLLTLTYNLFGQINVNVDFSGNPVSGPAPLTVQFTTDIGIIPPGDIQMVYYDFGDGSTSYYELHPSHTYTDTGTYTVSIDILAPPFYRGQKTKENYITVYEAIEVAQPTFDPSPGNYVGPVDVTISCTTTGATIYFTTNGLDPTKSDSVYTSPIHIDSTMTLKARAYKGDLNPSDITVGLYNIKYVVSQPTFNPLPGVYNSPIEVTISCATTGATMHYTTNGLDPTENDSVYTSPIYIDLTMTLKSRAYKNGLEPSEIKTGSYYIRKWSINLGDPIISSPAIGQDGTIYVASYDRNFYAFNPDGTEKWVFTTGWRIESSPAIDQDGTIYIGSWDEKFYAINPNGTEKWVFNTDGYVQSSAAIGYDGTIYVGCKDGKLYALNPDGTEKWAFAMDSTYFSDPVYWPVYSSPAIDQNGTIYVGSWDDKLYALNPDGTEKWAFNTGGNVYSSPAIGHDGTIYVGSFDKNFYAVNSDGTEKWVFTTGREVSSSPAIGDDGTIYFGSQDHNFYALNPDGTEKWVFTTGGYIDSSPAIGQDGTIYFGSSDHKFYALNSDGIKVWEYTTGHLVNSSPAIDKNGTIYIGSSDSKLYAIYSESKGLSPSSWPKFRQNNQNTGLLRDPNTNVENTEIFIVPVLMQLKQNYPNPFNPSTTFKFSLNKSRFVSLKVYNLLGKEVETIISEFRHAGEYEVEWNAEDFPSGMYLYRLEAGDFVETKKLILQR